MCQQMVSGVSFDTGNFIVASETATSCMKSLFYGLLETYFAVYDSVVLTGPLWVSSQHATAHLYPLGRRRRRDVPHASSRSIAACISTNWARWAASSSCTSRSNVRQVIPVGLVQ